MKKRLVLPLCVAVAAFLCAGAAFAEPSVRVDPYNIFFEESPTDEMVAKAAKDFKDAGGDITMARINISTVDDAGLQRICKAFPEAADIYLTKGEVSSLAPLAELKGLLRLGLRDLPKVTDISPLAASVKLTDLQVKRVAYGTADLKWIALMTELRNIRLEDIDPALKSLEGIEGLANLAFVHLNASLNADQLPGTLPDLTPVAKIANMEELNLDFSDGDLTPLKDCKKLRVIALALSKFKDLTPLAGIASLQEVRLNKDGFPPEQVKALTDAGKTVTQN